MDKTQQGVWGGQELGAACFGVKTYIYQSQGKKRVKGEASMTARACSLVGLRERFFILFQDSLGSHWKTLYRVSGVTRLIYELVTFILLWLNAWWRQERNSLFYPMAPEGSVHLLAVMCLGRTLWPWNTMVQESCSLHGGQKAERQGGARNETYPSICSN